MRLVTCKILSSYLPCVETLSAVRQQSRMSVMKGSFKQTFVAGLNERNLVLFSHLFFDRTSSLFFSLDDTILTGIRTSNALTLFPYCACYSQSWPTLQFTRLLGT